MSDSTTSTTSTSPTSLNSLKSRIKHHYDLCSSYYHSLWGEHIHHGYFVPPDLPKDVAQIELIKLLVTRAGGLESPGLRVLDVGCGIGGTSRYLAREHGCEVTGITISGEQVGMARKLSGASETGNEEEPIRIQTSDGSGQVGSVRFFELDAESMGEYFDKQSFDVIWISEALSHFPNKALFFQNVAKLLSTPTTADTHSRLVLADWFKAPSLTAAQYSSDIRPIESGMLLPPLCSQQDYLSLAAEAGLEVLAEPLDISKEVAKTWDLSVALVADPKLWALAFTQGRDFIAFLRAFQAMRAGFRNGTFRYAVVVWKWVG